MSNIDLFFSSPWILILIIPLLFLTVFPYLRLNKKRRTKKHLISLICRSIALVLLVVMLSGVTYMSKLDDTSVIILVDLSDSTLPMRDSMDSFTKELLENTDKDTRIGIMAFADSCVYELRLDSGNEFTSLSDLKAESVGSATNIEDALRTAASEIETDTYGRVILLSDGKETKGNAETTAVELAYQQIRVDSVFFSKENSGSDEVQINDMSIPENAYAGDTFTISITVNSTVETSGVLTIYDDNSEVMEQEVTIQKGINTYTLETTTTYSGVHTFKVVLDASSDSITQNNLYYSYIKILGSPNILIVDGTGSESRQLRSVLGDNYKIQKTPPEYVPNTLAEIQKFDEIILMNVSASDLPEGFDELIETYVKALGRSVFTTGGENTYYYGSMKGTRFEDLLPINIDVEDNDTGSTALVIVIDCSSSMQGTPIMLAKEGAINCVNALDDTDYVGIISFAGSTEIVSPLTSAANRKTVNAAIDALMNSRGTYLYDAVVEAYDQLKDSDAENKHVLILSDGEPADSGYASVIQTMRSEGITTSTILCGYDITYVSSLMQSLANLGGGQYYEVDDIIDLPEIMLNAAQSLLTSYISEGIFTPTIGQVSAVLSGVSSIPELGGYIITSIKNGATNVLYSDENRPIYAEWKYGLGRVVSFMSDLSGDWSDTFLSDEQGIKFIENIITYLIPRENQTTGLTVDITKKGSQANICAKTVDSTNNSKVEAVVMPPKGDRYTVILNAVSSGVYESTIETMEEGVYTLFVQQTDTDGELLGYREVAVASSYSAEYDAFLEGGDKLLESVSNLAGGELMSTCQELLSVETSPSEIEKNLYIPLGLIATFLLLADLVMRNTKWQDIKMFFRT